MERDLGILYERSEGFDGSFGARERWVWYFQWVVE